MISNKDIVWMRSINDVFRNHSLEELIVDVERLLKINFDIIKDVAESRSSFDTCNKSRKFAENQRDELKLKLDKLSRFSQRE